MTEKLIRTNPLMTAPEVARALFMSLSTWHRMVNSGNPPIPVAAVSGNRKRWWRKDVERYLEEMKHQYD